MIRVKICGITNEEDINICTSAGVDALGFVVEYPIPVPWNLEKKTARRLMESVPPFVSKVAVLGDDPDEVLSIADFLDPNVIQLHGEETLNSTEKLIFKLKSRGIKVIKALRFSVETGKLRGDILDPLAICKRLADAGIDAVVLDSVTGSKPAGTGSTFDWKVARRIRDDVSIPVILAGGLNAGNVSQAVSDVRPYGVDVISGVENPVGKKDPARVHAFLMAVRCAA